MTNTITTSTTEPTYFTLRGNGIDLCIFALCGNTEIYSRGLCHDCYRFVKRLESKAKVNLMVLERSGKILGAERTGKRKVQPKLYHERLKFFLGLTEKVAERKR